MQAKTIVKAFEAAACADNVLSAPADLATYASDAAVLDNIYPNLAQAIVVVLSHRERGIFMPEKQVCCKFSTACPRQGMPFR